MSLSKLDCFFQDKIRLVRVVRCINNGYWYSDKVGKYYLVEVGQYDYRIITEIKLSERIGKALKENGVKNYKDFTFCFDIKEMSHNGNILTKCDCNVILRK